MFVCVLLGMLAWTYMDFMKKQVDRRNLDGETEQIRTDLVQLKQATAGIEDLGRKIDDLQKAIDFFESKLPQEKEMDKILAEVSQMADANALQTKTVKTLKSERTANYSEQPIQMSLSGDFNGFYAFLLQLEKLARITRVTQMNLQKIDEHDGQMQAQMTLSIYFEPENGAVAGAH
jgi:type IV pilus assembly protein PilO